MINILFGLFGVCCAILIPVILNMMPAKCFCDYDETPDERHATPRVGKWSILICGCILAAVFLIISNRQGLCIESIFICLLCMVLLMITISDIRYCIIPDELIIIGVIFATISVFPSILSGLTWINRLEPILGAIVGAGSIFAINLLGQILYNKDALGMGDLKLMIVCGIVCGPVGTVVALLISLLSAGIWFGIGIAIKKIQAEAYLPLGPFLVFGTIFTLSFRPMIDAFLEWYISLI